MCSITIENLFVTIILIIIYIYYLLYYLYNIIIFIFIYIVILDSRLFRNTFFLYHYFSRYEDRIYFLNWDYIFFFRSFDGASKDEFSNFTCVRSIPISFWDTELTNLLIFGEETSLVFSASKMPCARHSLLKKIQSLPQDWT